MIYDIYSNVKLPQMRQILIDSLSELADIDLHRTKWMKPEAKHSIWDNLMFDVHVIFDDFELDKEPENKIGYILVNREEAEILKPLIRAFEEIFDSIGERQTDEAYITSPLWDQLAKAAQSALTLYISNETKAQETNPHPWKGEDNWDQL